MAEFGRGKRARTTNSLLAEFEVAAVASPRNAAANRGNSHSSAGDDSTPTIKELIASDTLGQARTRLVGARIRLRDGTIARVDDIAQGTDTSLRGKRMRDWTFVLHNLSQDPDLKTAEDRWCSVGGTDVATATLL